MSYKFFIIDHLPKKQVIHKIHQLLSSSTPKIHEELQKNTPKKIMKLASSYTTSKFRFTEKNSHNKHPFNPIELLTFLHSCFFL